MNNIEISGPALDTKTNLLIYPVRIQDQQNVINSNLNIKNFLHSKILGENEKERYKCLICKEFVFPKRGNIKRWHFSHFNNTECKEETVKLAESEKHKIAKFMLYEKLLNKEKIDVLLKDCICKNTKNTKNILKNEDIISISLEGKSHKDSYPQKLPTLRVGIIYSDEDEVFMEYIIDKLDKNSSKVDIVVLRKNSLSTNQKEIKYIFEICNTSKTKTKRPEPFFEFDAGDVIEKLSLDSIHYFDSIYMLKDTRNRYCESCNFNENNNNFNINEEHNKKISKVKSQVCYKTWNLPQIAKALGFSYTKENRNTELNTSLMWRIRGHDIKNPFLFEEYGDKDFAEKIWKEFINRRKCMKCEKDWNTEQFKPFCKNCYIEIRKSENRIEKVYVRLTKPQK